MTNRLYSDMWIDRPSQPVSLNRRKLLASVASVVAANAFVSPAVTQTRTKLRLGHLHVVAVDGHILTGLDRDSFAKHGIEFELFPFDTGPEVFDALAAGKIDVLSAGGVISNNLALGAGRAFLINNIEIATAQLWVRPDLGVSTFADLRGKRVATTMRTTAHIFLERALGANDMRVSDIQIVDARMSAAVDAFIAGEVPAVALWVPFNIAVRNRVPGAIKLVDASAFYPQSAVVGGWAVRREFHEKNRDTLSRIVRGWADANDYIIRNVSAAADGLQKRHYPNASVDDIAEAFKAQKMFSSREWRRLYSDGTVVKWLQQVSDFFMRDAGVAKPTSSSEYFDPSIYLSAV